MTMHPRPFAALFPIHRYWTAEETRRLKRYLTLGRSIPFMSEEFGRSEKSIKAKIYNLKEPAHRAPDASKERLLFEHWRSCRENGLTIKFGQPPRSVIVLASEVCAAYAGVPSKDVLGRDRAKPIAHARQAVMAYLHACGYGYSPISKRVKLHHTSIMNAVRACDRREEAATICTVDKVPYPSSLTHLRVTTLPRISHDSPAGLLPAA